MKPVTPCASETLPRLIGVAPRRLDASRPRDGRFFISPDRAAVSKESFSHEC